MNVPTAKAKAYSRNRRPLASSGGGREEDKEGAAESAVADKAPEEDKEGAAESAVADKAPEEDAAMSEADYDVLEKADEATEEEVEDDAEQEDSDEDEDDLADLGRVKQKPADLRWWVRGVHQVILWVGTARRGKGKGKGKAKAKAKGRALAKAKGRGSPRRPQDGGVRPPRAPDTLCART